MSNNLPLEQIKQIVKDNDLSSVIILYNNKTNKLDYHVDIESASYSKAKIKEGHIDHSLLPQLQGLKKKRVVKGMSGMYASMVNTTMFIAITLQKFAESFSHKVKAGDVSVDIEGNLEVADQTPSHSICAICDAVDDTGQLDRCSNCGRDRMLVLLEEDN